MRPRIKWVIRKPTHCPRCQYALVGLSGEVTCPECGLRVDVSRGAFYASLNLRIVYASMIAASLVTSLGAVWIARTYGVSWMILLALLSCMCSLYVVLQVPRFPERVWMVSSDGVTELVNRRHARLFPWDSIQRVAVEDGPTPSVVIYAQAGDEERNTGQFAIGSLEAARALMLLISQGRSDQRSSARDA